MIEFYADLDPVDTDHICQGELKSEVMFKEDKKYHVDLKVTLTLRSDFDFRVFFVNNFLFLSSFM